VPDAASLLRHLRTLASTVDDEDVRAEWSRRLTSAHALWSGVTVDEQTFLDYVVARISALEDWSLQATQDLYLACACAGGDARAVEALHAGPLRAAAVQLRGRFGDEQLADASQAISVQLLAPAANGSRGVSSYRGKGDLRGWLRLLLVREVLQQLRPEARQQRIKSEAQSLPEAVYRLDPEALLLEARYRHVFRAAFDAALASLSQPQQRLLRYYFVERMTIDELGAVYRVHRATISRRVGDVRAALLEATREGLMQRLSVAADEVDSIIRLVDSKLEISFSRILAADADPL
jgi:RNA polymerase sigma-70 factor (ECF subfamily)